MPRIIGQLSLESRFNRQLCQHTGDRVISASVLIPLASAAACALNFYSFIICLAPLLN